MSLHIQGQYFGTRSDADTASQLAGEKDIREARRVQAWLARTLDPADYASFKPFWDAAVAAAEKVSTAETMAAQAHHILTAASVLFFEEIQRRDDAELDAIHDSEAAA